MGYVLLTPTTCNHCGFSKTFNKSGKCTTCINNPLIPKRVKDKKISVIKQEYTDTGAIAYKRRPVASHYRKSLKYSLEFVNRIKEEVLTEKALNGGYITKAYPKVAKDNNLEVWKIRYIFLLNTALRTDNPEREKELARLDSRIRTGSSGVE